MKPIFLIGYMGSGKTTLGRNLAKKMGLEFIDLDIFIENRYHSSVREIFEKKGEESFRKIERSILHEVSEFQNVIVACGGGTPCHFDNMDFMYRRGLTIYLDTSIETLFKRLSVTSAMEKRPLLAGKSDVELNQFITDALGARSPFYSRAKISFDSNKLDNFPEINKATDILAELIQKENA